MIAALLALVISMPAGWERIAVDNPPGSSIEMLDIARGPTVDNFREQINVLRHRLSDSAMSLPQWVEQSTGFLKDHDSRVVASRAERLCNGTMDGWWIESLGTYSEKKLDLIQAAVLDGGFEYVATYTRAEGADADGAALKALETLCPLKP